MREVGKEPGQGEFFEFDQSNVEPVDDKEPAENQARPVEGAVHLEATEIRARIADLYTTTEKQTELSTPPPVDHTAVEEEPNYEARLKSKIRSAKITDIDRLVDIDLARYRRVYGKQPPSRAELVEMFTKRFNNATDKWMFVCEVEGRIEGFITGFRTNKSMEDFVSWENSTANGTLDGSVDPKGRYVYGVNMTVNPKGMQAGGDEKLLIHLITKSIESGVEYGYFLARMPLFSAWIRREIRSGSIDAEKLNESPDYLDALAKHYSELKENKDGQLVPQDPELQMYEEAGFERGKLVRKGFEDPMSLDYGVLFKVDIPPTIPWLKRNPLVRVPFGRLLKWASKSPRLSKKLF